MSKLRHGWVQQSALCRLVTEVSRIPAEKRKALAILGGVMGALCFSGFSDISALNLNPLFLLIVSQKENPGQEEEIELVVFSSALPRPVPSRPSAPPRRRLELCAQRSSALPIAFPTSGGRGRSRARAVLSSRGAREAVGAFRQGRSAAPPAGLRWKQRRVPGRDSATSLEGDWT